MPQLLLGSSTQEGSRRCIQLTELTPVMVQTLGKQKDVTVDSITRTVDGRIVAKCSMYAVRQWSIDFVEQSHINCMAQVCHEIKETVSLEPCMCGERYEQWGRRPAPPCSECAKTHVRKASPDKTGTKQGGSKGKRAKFERSDGKYERKREREIQHPREAVKKTITHADIRHVFSDPSHGSKVGLSAASITNHFQASILWQEFDHDPMPMDAYEGSSEQARCDIVAASSSAPSHRDLPPLQLKVNLPLLKVELD